MTADWALGDAGNLPFGSERFAGAVCTHVLEELEPSLQRKTAQELWRVLRSDGRLMVVTAASDGVVPEGAKAVGENAFLFRSQGRETVLHMSSREQLLGLFGAFRVDELIHMRWDVPQLTPIRAHWVLMASRQNNLVIAE
jgi:ubiquinone/menaquinone biosynthesis C-methylase UbiE